MKEKILSLFLFSLLFVGCLQKPTKIKEDTAPQASTKALEGVSKTQADEMAFIEANPDQYIFIDARSTFDFELSHYPQAISIRYEDFSQKEEPFNGLLEKDLYFHARRLARMGIGPASKLIIVGKGQQGEGDEFRLAWILQYMGLKNILVAHVDQFVFKQNSFSVTVPAPLPIWEPAFDESMIAEYKEVLNIVTLRQKAVLIDARSESEYLGKVKSSQWSTHLPEIEAINIPWTQFITGKNEFDISLKERIKTLGLGPDDRIVTISNRGVRSSVAALALRKMGFKNVGNFTGGYTQLISLSGKIRR